MLSLVKLKAADPCVCFRLGVNGWVLIASWVYSLVICGRKEAVMKRNQNCLRIGSVLMSGSLLKLKDVEFPAPAGQLLVKGPEEVQVDARMQSIY